MADKPAINVKAQDSASDVRPTKADVVKEFRVREIIEAARRVFTREGFKKASMDKIADEAGLAKGTVYLYFPTKDQLVAATLEAGAEGFFGLARDRSSGPGDPVERLRALVLAMIGHAEEDRDFQRALFGELNEWLVDPNRLVMVQQMVAQHDSFISYIASIIAEGIRQGTFNSQDPDRAARYLFHLLGGNFRERLIGVNSQSVEESARDISSFFINAITPKGTKP